MTRKRDSKTRRESFRERERRGNLRYAFPTSLRYRLPQNGGKAEHGRIINVGGSGFCAVLYHPVEAGQEIIIEKCFLPFPQKSAVVRWVKGFQLDIYIVGFQCGD